MPWGTHWRDPRGSGSDPGGHKEPGGGGGGPPARARRRHPFLYNLYTGALQQGAAGTAGSSTRPIDDPNRAARTAAGMAIDGVQGVSDVVLWEKVEPFAPTDSRHVYNSLIFDLALAEADLYPGSHRLFRVNGGDNGSATWLQGGGTSVLEATPATGQKIINLAGRSLTDGSLPLVGSTCSLTGEPDAEEGSVVTASDPATGNVTLTANITGVHLAKTIVEWTKLPAAFQAFHAYAIGDIIIAPPGGFNTLGVPADGFLYVASKAYTSGASFWPIEPTLVETIVGNDGTTMPAIWDPNMVTARNNMTAWLGSKYNGDPRLEAVFGSGGGRSGEVGCDIGNNPGAQQRVSSWLSHGFNDWTSCEVWKSIADAYSAAFPNTPKIQPLGEAFGQGQVWPNAIALANCTTNAASSSVSCTSSAGAVVGMLVFGHPDVQNLYVGTVPDGTHITLASDQQGTAANARGSHAGLALQLNSTSRVAVVSGVTNENAPITCASIALADRGKLVTIAGGSARRYVGPTGLDAIGIALGLGPTQFLESTKRIPPFSVADYNANHRPAANAGINGQVAATLAYDGLNYSTLEALGGIVAQYMAGKNPGGALTNDVYSGGTPTAGYLAGKGWAVHQNGLAPSDLNSNPLGRYRPVISGASANAIGNPNAVLQLAAGGYQEVAGGVSLQNVTDELDVASDDDILRLEIYFNNAQTAAASVVPNFANGIRP